MIFKKDETEIKYCPCEKGKEDSEYIQCPLHDQPLCPCDLNKCLLYAIYENSISVKYLLAELKHKPLNWMKYDK